MAVQFIDNLSYLGAKPNFVRDSVSTTKELSEMKNDKYDNGHLVYCLADKKVYVFDSNVKGKYGNCVPLTRTVEVEKGCLKKEDDAKEINTTVSINLNDAQLEQTGGTLNIIEIDGGTY